MMKNNKKPRGKVKTMIISVVVAILIWAAVIYINPPEMTTTISNLPVRIVGEETLRERGLAVVGRNNILGLSVSVKGKRNDLLNMSGGIYVDVDVSDITRSGEFDFAGNVSLPSSKLTLDSTKFDYVPLKVEEITTKEIPVRTEVVGKNDAYLIEPLPETNTITLEGAKSEMDNISYALLSIDSANMNEDVTVETGFVYMNSNNIPIPESETIRANTDIVTVECRAYHAVTVNVVPTLSQTLEKSYVLNTDKTTVSPQTIRIGVYDKNSSVTTVNAVVTEIKDEVTAPLEEADGIFIPPSLKTVTVRPVADKIIQKPITVNVTATNVIPGLNARVNPVTVTVSGKENDITPENIHASVNLSGMTQGEYSVEVEISSDNLTIDGKYYAEVTIS